MKKKFVRIIVLAVIFMAIVFVKNVQADTLYATNEDELEDQLLDGNTVYLKNDVAMDRGIQLKDGEKCTLNLNGHTLYASFPEDEDGALFFGTESNEVYNFTIDGTAAGSKINVNQNNVYCFFNVAGAEGSRLYIKGGTYSNIETINDDCCFIEAGNETQVLAENAKIKFNDAVLSLLDNAKGVLRDLDVDVDTTKQISMFNSSNNKDSLLIDGGTYRTNQGYIALPKGIKVNMKIADATFILEGPENPDFGPDTPSIGFGSIGGPDVLVNLLAEGSTFGQAFSTYKINSPGNPYNGSLVYYLPKTYTIKKMFAEDDLIYSLGSDEDLKIVSTGDFDIFKDIYVDDVPVDATNYTVAKGSTILTLKSSYLETLSKGAHALRFDYNDGSSVKTTFIVAEGQDKPNADPTENKTDENTVVNDVEDEKTAAEEKDKDSTPKTGRRDIEAVVSAIVAIALITFIAKKSKVSKKTKKSRK